MPTIDPYRIEKFLIVRLSAIGDILHGLPVARALKRWRPEVQVAWLVEDRFSCLLRNVSEIDEIIEVPRKRWKSGVGFGQKLHEALALRHLLKSKNFEVSVDLQGLTKSAIWPWMAGVPLRIGFGDSNGRELSRMMSTVHVIPDERRPHIIDRNLSLLSALEIEDLEVDCNLPVDTESAAIISGIAEERGWNRCKLAFIQPGAGWPTKRWHPEYYARLADWLNETYGYRVIALWGPGEEDLAQSVLSAMKQKSELAPNTNLLELIELIRLGKLFIGGDTGPMHIAAAMGVPTAAIFGASDPLRNGPYGKGNITIAHELECSLCWKKQCDNIRCLKELLPERVIEEMEKFLTDM